jgi:hypothetical protein
MSQESLFRFMSVRPANPQHKLERAPAKAPLYTPQTSRSDFQTAIARVQGTPNPENAILGIVASFRQSGHAVATLKELKFPVDAGVEWAIANAKRKVSEDATKTSIESALGNSVTQLVQSADFEDALVRIADSVYAETLDPSASGPKTFDRLVLGHKFLLLLMQLASGLEFAPGTTVADMVGARTVIVPSGAPPRQGMPQQEPPPSPLNPRTAQVEEAKAKLSLYEQAHREITNLTTKPGSLVPIAPTESLCDARLALLEQRVAAVETRKPDVAIDAGADE